MVLLQSSMYFQQFWIMQGLQYLKINTKVVRSITQVVTHGSLFWKINLHPSVLSILLLQMNCMAVNMPNRGNGKLLCRVKQNWEQEAGNSTILKMTEARPLIWLTSIQNRWRNWQKFIVSTLSKMVCWNINNDPEVFFSYGLQSAYCRL